MPCPALSWQCFGFNLWHLLNLSSLRLSILLPSCVTYKAKKKLPLADAQTFEYLAPCVIPHIQYSFPFRPVASGVVRVG